VQQSLAAAVIGLLTELADADRADRGIPNA
jgi:hypothetical protein